MRQSTAAVSHEIYTRPDQGETMTSADAGVVTPLLITTVLQGDSVSGTVQIIADMAEMPRPLRNAAYGNFQAWFVPKASFPQFSSFDEYINSYEGVPIKALGYADRTPPPLFNTITGADVVTAAASKFFKTLGLHIPAGSTIPTDYVDAFVLVYNFRLAAHSSRLPLKEYMTESVANSLALPPAFWPLTPKIQSIVPDYEQALVVGSLDLDVVAGQIPVMGIAVEGTTSSRASSKQVDGSTSTLQTFSTTRAVDSDADGFPDVFAEMAGQSLNVTLADIEKARVTQAFAKLRQAYAGNDTTGFDNDDAIVASLMRGVQVPNDVWKRVMLLDSKRVAFNMQERFASDAANLDDSVTVGGVAVSLSVNIPTTPCGGYIVVTFEGTPERLFEAQADPFLTIIDRSQYPDALRDIQRVEPVDLVENARIDARHSTPNGLYGYEPMNAKFDRYFTRLGGDFFQDDPANPFNEQRSALWMPEVVDPTFTDDHYLCPQPFPKDVFADTSGDVYEIAVRHAFAIRGLTIRGDVLQESNDNFTAVEEA